MPQGPTIRPIGELAQAFARYGRNLFQPPNDTIRGIEPASWYSPLQPIQPFAPEGTEPRGFQFWPGQNLFWTPRPDSEFTAADLKDLARYPLARIAIENVKDCICKASWQIQPRPEPGESRKAATKRGLGDKDLLALNLFFEKPDRENMWDAWLRPLLEDMLVIDAWTILLRRTFNGEIVEMPVLRGEMITRYIDQNGYTPMPPDPAYAQNWWGMPLVNLTTDQLVYKPRNIVPRNTIASQLYGMSPTEQLAPEIDIGRERLRFVLSYYTEGSTPGVVQVVPRGTPPEQITAAMQWMNSELAGNLAARRQWRLIQGWKDQDKDEQIIFSKEPLLADLFDEQHTRRVAFGYGISPQRLMRQMNRASSQQADEAAEVEGLLPYFASLKSLMDYIIRFKMAKPAYEMVFAPLSEPDQEKQAGVVTQFVNAGVITRNEGRERIGEEQAADPGADELLVTTGSGPVPLDMETRQALLPIPPKGGDDDGVSGPSRGGDGKPGARAGADGEGEEDDRGGNGAGGRGKPRQPASANRGNGNGNKVLAHTTPTIGFTTGTPLTAVPGYIEFHKYDEDQPRDESGKWTSEGGGGKVLYHGTADAYAQSVLKDGLQPGSRHDVYASPDHKLALQYGMGATQSWYVNAALKHQLPEDAKVADMPVLLLTVDTAGFKDEETRGEFTHQGVVPAEQIKRAEVYRYGDVENYLRDRTGKVTLSPVSMHKGEDSGDTFVFVGPGVYLERNKLAKYHEDPEAPVIHPARLRPESIRARVRFEKRLKASFLDMRRRTVKALAKRFGMPHGHLAKDAQSDAVDEILRALADDWEQIGNAAADALPDAAVAGADQGGIQLRITDPEMLAMVNHVAADWAEGRAAELVGMKRDPESGEWVENPNPRWAITESTRDQLRVVVRDLFESEGERTLRGVEDRIEQAGIFSDTRASMIARTEISFAQNQGNLGTWRESGLVESVEWVLADDHDKDDVCDALATVYPVGEVPDFPAHPNCLCALVLAEWADQEGPGDGEPESPKPQEAQPAEAPVESPEPAPAPVETAPEPPQEPQKPAPGKKPARQVRAVKIEEKLRTSAVTSRKDIGGSHVSTVEKVKLEDGTTAIFKPHDGEPGDMRPEIEAGYQTERECGAWEVAKLAKMTDLGTPCIEREVEGERGAMMKRVAGVDAYNAPNKFDGERDKYRVAAYDYVIGNEDRHSGNWKVVVKSEQIHLIDHGLCFPEYGFRLYPDNCEFLNEAVYERTPAYLPQQLAGPYVKNKAKILAALERVGLQPQAIAGVGERIDNLAAAESWRDLAREELEEGL